MKGNTDKFPSIKLIRLVKQHQSPNYQAQASDSILTNSVNFTLCFSQQICSEVTRAPQNQRPAKSLLSKCDDDWSVCVRHSIHGDRKSGNCIASYFLSNKSTWQLPKLAMKRGNWSAEVNIQEKKRVLFCKWNLGEMYIEVLKLIMEDRHSTVQDSRCAARETWWGECSNEWGECLGPRRRACCKPLRSQNLPGILHDTETTNDETEGAGPT